MNLRPLLPTACLLALLMPFSVGAAETLGRLFFTPEQRSILDQQSQPAPASKEQGGAIRFDGAVLRSSGPNTYWLNGQARDARQGNIAEIVTGKNKASPEARVTSQGRPVHIRIGEAVNPSSGDKRVLLENDALRIHSARQ